MHQISIISGLIPLLAFYPCLANNQARAQGFASWMCEGRRKCLGNLIRVFVGCPRLSSIQALASKQHGQFLYAFI